jgi:signal transduction histidine kinase
MPEPEVDPLGPDSPWLRQAMDVLVDDAFVLLDGAYCIRFWSRGAEMMFGRSAADAVGLHLDRVFSGENRCWDLPDEQSEGGSKRCWFTLPDGSQRYLVATTKVLRDNSACIGLALHAHVLPDDGALSSASSETLRPVAECVPALSEQLREMSARLEAEQAERAAMDRTRVLQLRGIVASQENERGRIARELREHIGQQLTALQLTVEALAAKPADAPPSDVIARTLEMIAGIGRGLDAVAWELRPAALDEFGLSAVLRNYVQQWSRHAGIRGSFHSSPQDSERFLPEVEATLYRIARTALETAEHTGANSVDVLLERRGANALLVVEDDTAAATESRSATGFTQMRERAAALGGSIEIEPNSRGGSVIRACVPLLTSSYAGPFAAGGPQSGAADYAMVNQLQVELAELRTALAARDEFVATVAHELRNPVAPLIFQIRLAIETTDKMVGAKEHLPPEWAQSQFRRLEQRLHRLLETLDRLLDVSRLSTGRVDLQPEPVTLARVVREIVSSFEAELNDAQCPLTFEERSAPRGSWDRMRIEQICRNLLSNAIRFGAGRPIEVSIDADTDFAILQVRDHGVGIARDQQARMFERFERGAEPRKGGFGIGLWVVKNICAAMGGTISVESAVGEGACFTVMLPRDAIDSADPAHSDALHGGPQ